jgi:hypothetical protein
MKLIDVASAVKAADSENQLEAISVRQIQRILAQAMREIRGAVMAAEDEMLVVPGLGRFRSRLHDIKPSADAEAGAEGEAEEPGQRRVIKFFPARDDREGRAAHEADEHDAGAEEPAGAAAAEH